ncbi:MAG: gamma-glutamyltransferase family protein [Nitrososphaerales archaeon]|nr:gamma-glutamyltransferase family protein [Nitrososphaerales archaeon]
MTLSKVAFFEHGVVASEQPLASLAGSEVLRRGGNAFDAALATSFALAVTFHPAGGLGGDFFAMVHEAKSGRVHCLNASGWAPSGLSVDLLKAKGNSEVPLFGPFSVVVPGFVAGITALHKRFGKVGLRGLLSPAISYSKRGFPAGEGICRSVAGTYDTLSAEARRVFAPEGRPPSPGDWIRQENLGKVIEDISRGGAAAFYKGPPADKISEKLTALGVQTKRRDFDFKPEWVEPLTLNYNGTTVYEVPPNSMGATTLLMLKYLSKNDLRKTGPLSRERIALTMEAAAFAYGRRDELLGDPRFGRVDMANFMRISSGPKAPPQGKLRDGDTTAFSVVDKDGNVVSAIQSLFHHFGSKVFVEDCGIMLSNRGAGFRMSGPNKLEPRKRPLHTLSALLMDCGDGPTLAIGTSGGEYRPFQHTLFVTNIVDYSMSLEHSIDHPRFLWSGERSLIAEAGYEPLAHSRYDVENLPHPGRTGACQAVEMLPKARKGVCDVRGDGFPTGY